MRADYLGGRRTGCTQIYLTMLHYKVVDERREMGQRGWKNDKRLQPSWMNPKNVFLNTFYSSFSFPSL